MSCPKTREIIECIIDGDSTTEGKEQCTQALAELDANDKLVEELQAFEKLAMESSTCKKCGTGITGYCLGCKIAKLEVENKLLRQYTEHPADCDIWKEDLPCNCGLTKLLKESEK